MADHGTMSMTLSDAQSCLEDAAQPAASGSAGSLHRETIGRLVREHKRSLHAFLMTRVGDEQEAVDVAQEAYVRMLQLERPDAISFMRAYLFKTAANIAINRAKERQNRLRLQPVEHEEEPVDEMTPDRLLLSAEEVEVFKLSLLELPPKCRRAFMLCRSNGCSDIQAAEQLGVQPRMVRHYLTQAVAYCRLRVKGLNPEQAREAMR